MASSVFAGDGINPNTDTNNLFPTSTGEIDALDWRRWRRRFSSPAAGNSPSIHGCEHTAVSPCRRLVCPGASRHGRRPWLFLQLAARPRLCCRGDGGGPPLRVYSPLWHHREPPSSPPWSPPRFTPEALTLQFTKGLLGWFLQVILIRVVLYTLGKW